MEATVLVKLCHAAGRHDWLWIIGYKLNEGDKANAPAVTSVFAVLQRDKTLWRGKEG